MSVSMGAGNLNEARKTLLARWDQLRSKWTDAVASRYEERFIAKLDKDLRNASQAMASMDGRLRQIRRECE